MQSMETEIMAAPDIITGLEEVTAAMDTAVSHITVVEATFSPGLDEWDIRENIAHLRDLEEIFYARCQLVLSENEPGLRAFNQDELAQAHKYHDADWTEVLAAFQAARRQNLEFLGRLTPEQWERAGIHEETGHLTIREMAEHLLNHNRTHLEEIEHVSWLAK